MADLSETSLPGPAPRPCAICGKPSLPRHRPFCSPRCADIDLGRWLKGAYVIPGAAIEQEDEEGRQPERRREDED